jgi:hypothetical protein
MLKKLLMMAKESENIQPGNAELKRKGGKHANVQNYCLAPLHKGACF